MRRLVVFVGAAVLALTSCQAGVSMWATCQPAADGNVTGTDGTYVLVCQNGEWTPIMTNAEFVAKSKGESVTIAPLPTRPTTTTSTTTTSTTTTTAPDPWAAAAGCYTYFSVFDLNFTGQVNVFGNAAFLDSNDGSCSGAPEGPPGGTNTFVEAADQATADALCDSLDPGPTVYNAFHTAGQLAPVFPIADMWSCVG